MTIVENALNVGINALKKLLSLSIFGFLGSALAVTNTFAQNASELRQQLDSASAIIAQLDDLAGKCNNSTSASSDDCINFLNAIDGDPVKTYIAHCDSLKNWREEYVENHDENTSSQIVGDAQALELLVGTQFNCGENALSKRSDNIASAYDYAAKAPRSLGSSSNQRDYRLQRKQSQFDQLDASERNRLNQSIDVQRSRTNDQNQNLNNALQQELIRQQIIRRDF